MHGLILWLFWVDGCLITGKEQANEIAKKQMMNQFDCNNVDKLKEHVGCKIDCNKEEG